MRRRARRQRVIAALVGIVAAAVAGQGLPARADDGAPAEPVPAATTATPVPAATAAPPVPAGGRVLYVAPSGSDAGSRLVAAQAPLATIGRAIRLAQPGDTIVVRGGTYVGPAGDGAVPGREDAPIRLRNAPGERVLIEGTLQLENANYWQVSGINVTQQPGGPRKEFLVKFDGGTGWSFTGAEVWGTRGVSNVMISGSAKNGAPRDYRLADNCIHSNRATGDPFMNDHNVYLMPGYDSGPGLIERNLFFDSVNGAAIKAAGPTAATGAGRVLIRRNSVARSAAGVIIGHGSNRIQIRDNLFTHQLKRPPAGALWVRNYDAAVIGNHVSGRANTVLGNAVAGFPHALRSTGDSTRPPTIHRTHWVKPRFDSITSCAGFFPADPTAASFGARS